MKLLFLAQSDFVSENENGGVIITRRNYKILCAILGHDNVDIAIIAKDNISKGFVKNKSAIWIEGNIRGIRNTINEIFDHTYVTAKGEKKIFEVLNRTKYDVVWLDSTHYGTLARKIKKRFNIKIVSYAYDFESEYMKMYCTPSIMHPNYYIKMFRVRQNEQDAILYSDKFICISERDRSLYLKKYHCQVDMVLPVTLDDRFDNRSGITSFDSKYILFVGSYFKPNIEGIMWFASNVAPKIKADVHVIGNGMEKLNAETLPDNIKILGRVDNLAEHYINASAVIMPIFSGSGMKVKTAEAMMYGKPILATDEALQGYDIDAIEGVYRCNTAEAFIDAIRSVLKTRVLFYQQIRDHFVAAYCTETAQMALKTMLMEIGA